MQLSNDLKRMLAEHTYESTRSMLMVTAPSMKPWDQLEGSEQAQCMEAMRMWLAGLGSNEVAEEWYNRSGQIPRAIWDQVPDGPDKTIFIMAALDMLNRLIAEAEIGLKYTGLDNEESQE
jgi:hypothetical protein